MRGGAQRVIKSLKGDGRKTIHGKPFGGMESTASTGQATPAALADIHRSEQHRYHA
ncbi:MAG: hypothetical protein P0Y59_03100 [Candidatus Sphingomonas phytovorans]|nr:hypothetical protein [Sphingomonas sp.]WEK00696.1 MAG: hypothetical protein P0Y59_03100 [Sphingomonas sp.]